MNSAIAYGNPTMQGKFSCHLKGDFEKIVNEFKNAITQRNLWILAEINPQLLLKKSSIDIFEARQLLFFHPRFMVKLLTLDPSAVIAVPLKIVLVKHSDGNIYAQATEPIKALQAFGQMNELAVELDKIVTEVFYDIAIKAIS